jgi:hypothetical protein
MAKIIRKVQKIFGSLAGANQIAKFGSLYAGASAFTTDPEQVQSFSNYLTGWYAAAIGGNSPSIEDVNALFFLYAYQLAYLMQAGVPEWEAQTTYYIGSLAQDGLGNIYSSLVDNNLANALSTTANWKLLGSGATRTVAAATDTALVADNFLRLNGTGLSLVETLPPIASCSVGQTFIVKNVSTDGSTVTLKGNAAELIEGLNTLILASTPSLESVTVKSNGTTWDII